MTVQLTNAEYRRLEPIERAQYWHGMYTDAVRERDELRNQNAILKQALRRIREALHQLPT